MLNEMRPKVICHIMSSVDGRLINERWTPPFNGETQTEVVAEYAKAGKELATSAWMFGLNTARAFLPEKYLPENETPAGKADIFRVEKTSERWFIVSDPNGEIRYNKNTVRGDNIICLLSRNVSKNYLYHLRSAGISYVFAGDDGSDLTEALESLHKYFGINSISLQGGGIINGAFLKAGHIDELSLAIYPGIDGQSGIPSIFECLGQNNELPAKGQSLELKSVRQLGNGVVWLRYAIHHS